MDDQLYSITEFLLSTHPEDKPPAALKRQRSSTNLRHQHSTSTITKSRVSVGSDYTEEEEAGDGACTFMEFLKEVEHSTPPTQPWHSGSKHLDYYSEFVHQVCDVIAITGK